MLMKRWWWEGTQGLLHFKPLRPDNDHVWSQCTIFAHWDIGRTYTFCGLSTVQDTIGGKLAYKGRLDLDNCQIVDLPDGSSTSLF